jgi:hypothetical protein
MVFALMLLSGLAGCGQPQAAAPSLRSEAPLANGIERAAAYFSGKALVGDEAWMAKQGAWRLGGEFEAWADQLFIEERRLSGNQLRLLRLAEDRHELPEPLPVPDVGPEQDPSDRLSARDMKHIAETMRRASRCTKLSRSERDAFLADLERPGRSYVVTHQLWALVTGLHRGCIERRDFDRLRPVLATPVYRELLADTRFHDAMAERMAMLCYAGLASWVPADAIAMALASQDPSGAWIKHQVDIGPYATTKVLHASTLAFYALASVWADDGGST